MVGLGAKRKIEDRYRPSNRSELLNHVKGRKEVFLQEESGMTSHESKSKHSPGRLLPFLEFMFL